MATVLTTSHDANGGYTLYPSNGNLSAYLWDGSLVFMVADGATIALFQSTNPGAGSPTATSQKSFAATGATSSSLHNGDLFVASDGAGGSDVWVAFGENGNVGGAWVAHGNYSSSKVWTWDTTTSCIANGNGGGAVNQVSVVWTGTYLIVGLRAEVSSSVEYAINYTTTKNGTSGWQASVIQISGVLGSSTHYFGSLHYDASLGCTVAVYSTSTGVSLDKLKCRVLADGSSPALANWGSEVDLGVGTNLNINDFQGAATLLDHTTGKLFVAYYDGSGNNKSIGLVVGTITVNGASSTTSWGTPISVGTQSVNNDSPSLAMDSNGKLYIFWSNHTTGIAAADVFYATATSPYTSVSAATNLTNSGVVGFNHAMTPRRARLTAGYVPLLYVGNTASPYNIEYDNTSLTFTTGGGSVSAGASIALLAAGLTVSAGASIALKAAGLTKSAGASIALKATGVTQSAGASIALKAAGLSQSAAANIALKATGLTQSAGASVALKAANLQAQAGASLALKATNVTVAAGASIALKATGLSIAAAATIALSHSLFVSAGASIALKAAGLSTAAGASMALKALGVTVAAQVTMALRAAGLSVSAAATIALVVGTNIAPGFSGPRIGESESATGGISGTAGNPGGVSESSSGGVAIIATSNV